MLLSDVFHRWTERATEWSRYSAQVDAARLVTDILGDFERALQSQDDETLTLKAAAEASGYSADHIGREVRAGRIPNAGSPHRPRVRRRDLPRKPHRLRTEADEAIVPIGSKRQIAKSVVNSRNEEIHDG